MIMIKLFQKNFSLRGLPTTFIFNKELKAFAKVEGIIEWESEKFINWLKKLNEIFYFSKTNIVFFKILNCFFDRISYIYRKCCVFYNVGSVPNFALSIAVY